MVANAIPGIRTLRLKVKREAYAWLNAAAIETNTVWCDVKLRTLIVLPNHRVGDETGRSVGRSLPVHALLATTVCEAMGTTGPIRKIVLFFREEAVLPASISAGGNSRLSGMINISELLQASLLTTSQRC
jgi:IS5 family transposase